jgi:hypothetical protein
LSFAAQLIIRTAPSTRLLITSSVFYSLLRTDSAGQACHPPADPPHYRFPQADTLVLLAALLSLPHPEGVPPLTLSPQKQKEKTKAVLVAWIMEEATKAAVCCVWEDLHWADPSTLAIAHRTEGRLGESELYRLKGELTLQSKVQGPKSKVESRRSRGVFQKAIDIAQRQSAKSQELQATMSLARLWQSQGKHREAHTLLADIYGWFTEGFDTKDLQEAKKLLEELARSLNE